jgi:hypothetical protein
MQQTIKQSLQPNVLGGDPIKYSVWQGNLTVSKLI